LSANRTDSSSGEPNSAERLLACPVAGFDEQDIFVLRDRRACLRPRPLAVLKTNPDGAGIVQAIGPLKVLAGNNSASPTASQRFLIVTDVKDSSQVVLQQAKATDSEPVADKNP
jgi:hypothetical protein